MSRVAAVAPVLPDHESTQEEIAAELGALITPDPARRALLERLHAASGISTRRTVLPLGAYRDLGGFEAANDIWIREGTRLAAVALERALADAGIAPDELDFLLFTSVTGMAAPSIDARLVPRVGLRSDLRRLPSFGLGCVAGAAGLARVADYLDGHPDHVGALVSVELCSLTLQRDDPSMGNLVASGLFGDGAAAAVLVGEGRVERMAASVGRPRPRVIGSRSALYPNSEGAIGWDIGASGFRIVLTAEVPVAVEANIAEGVDALLGQHGLARDDIDLWIAHPGGPRVIDAFAQGLQLPDAVFAASRRSLAEVGNLSSASVLHLLADVLDRPAGTRAVLFALGPGVTSEHVLLEWS
ncbi:type III polyketide synthase [Homoserinibacter sp. GY 40078]|uniref:type III polyketide synthase n=1 Tax=Homoserinibacter sp. GY 40078 TaxID=2603275 RepID=UPI0011C6F1C5|nr:3-oxoacyl-[acyl-carrier-protein] synthase III C-terminal domain-containing protein [Homoserinibacter sp. GY 40078]TXK18848.1 type III polyketide synthase [Homoserinibacter sp. GY 40078]